MITLNRTLPVFRTAAFGLVLSLTVGCHSMNRRVSQDESTSPSRQVSRERARDTARESSRSTSSDTSMPPTISAAAAENASHVTEISFSKNSAELTQAAKEQLSSIADAARLSRKIDGVKILAWSDEEYPSVRARDLSKAERNLADRRAKAIKSFLSSNYDVRGADTINMASRPNALQKLFKTDDARLKRAMETAGMRDSDSSNAARTGKAS